MIMRLSDNLQVVLSNVFEEAQRRHHEFITPEHLLLCALRDQEIRAILEDCQVAPERVNRDLVRFLAANVPKREGVEPGHSVGFQSVLARAAQHTDYFQREYIELRDILVSIFDEPQCYGSYFLRQAGLTRYKLLRRISHGSASYELEEDDSVDDGAPSEEFNAQSEESGGSERAFESSSERARVDGEQSEEEAQRKASTRRDPLKKFIIDLTKRARDGELDPLIGRHDILDRTIQVLCRRRKNNPVHVGDPGVGKTAITEGLATRIAEGKVPAFLKGFSIYALNIGDMIAGTRFRGDFEERMKKMISTLEQRKDVILFIDEIHSIVGAGSPSGSSVDASSMLKPLLTSGTVRCIGATTYADFRRSIERDHALTRRFQKVEVPELSVAESVKVLKGLRNRYEEYHHVRYDDAVLESAAHLASQYINERRLPDKAIDVIDECGAAVQVKRQTIDEQHPPEMVPVSVKSVEEVVARMAQIPPRTVNLDERQRLKDLHEALSKKLFGQESAVHEVSEAIKRSRAGFRAPNKPVASLLFVGPTGVGKTELARQLALHLGVELLRFDMSEYQERHTVSRLIGSPPGYVGFEEGAQLTDAVRRTPHAVLLLDEIEKAHPDIQHILLQIMDYATVTDNSGKKADFRNIILIMTSNAGARQIGSHSIGFTGARISQEAMEQAVQNIFTPEFRGRLDRVVTFRDLPLKVVESVVRREIKLFNQQLAERQVKVVVSPRVIRWAAKKSYSFNAGARDVARTVEQHIRSWFVDQVLFGPLAQGGTVDADLQEDAIVFTLRKGVSKAAAKKKRVSKLKTKTVDKKKSPTRGTTTTTKPRKK